MAESVRIINKYKLHNSIRVDLVPRTLQRLLCDYWQAQFGSNALYSSGLNASAGASISNGTPNSSSFWKAALKSLKNSS